MNAYSKKNIALVLLVCGLVGLLDSFYLVTEYFAALTSNGAETPCSPNSMVSCTKTVQGGWANLLGVSNPLFGMLWYGMWLMYGASRYLGSSFSRQTRLAVGALCDLGLLFSFTLYIASVTVLRGVCPFCLLSTMLSVIAALAFTLDDRTYTDAIVTDKWRPYIYGFQVFSVTVYCLGLIVFFSYYLPMLVQPMEAITHWSFPVILVLIATMAVGNYWAYKGLQKEVPHTHTKPTLLGRLFHRK